MDILPALLHSELKFPSGLQGSPYKSCSQAVRWPGHEWCVSWSTKGMQLTYQMNLYKQLSPSWPQLLPDHQMRDVNPGRPVGCVPLLSGKMQPYPKDRGGISLGLGGTNTQNVSVFVELNWRQFLPIQIHTDYRHWDRILVISSGQAGIERYNWVSLIYW